VGAFSRAHAARKSISSAGAHPWSVTIRSASSVQPPMALAKAVHCTASTACHTSMTRLVQVSLHCVKAYGHLQQALTACTPDNCPPRIMLHSYGGSAEQVKAFTGIGAGGEADGNAVGRRIYFSFSAAIGNKMRQKTLDRIRAVPDDCLLVETDLEDQSGMNDALKQIVEMMAKAKGWTVEQAVDQTWQNYLRFYDGFLSSRSKVAVLINWEGAVSCESD
jgi:Tat protein secretion system quality control protein TatD with DNase activity